jgi:hypothetical protein
LRHGPALRFGKLREFSVFDIGHSYVKFWVALHVI